MTQDGDLSADRFSRPATKVLVLLYAGYLLSFGDRIIFGMVMKPIKETFGFSDAQLGLLSGVAFAASYALFSPLAGWLVDRQPRRLVMAVAVSFWSAMTFATGLAGSFLAMAISRMGVGAGEAFLHPLAVSMVSDTVPERQRPRAFGFYLSAGAVGSALALLLGGLLIKSLMTLGEVRLPVLGVIEPWQALFFAAAVPGFLLSVVILASLREPRRLTADHAAPTSDGETAFAFFRRHPALCLAVFAGISTVQMASYTVSTWKIPFFERVHGWSAADASLRLGLFAGVTTLLGCLAAGRMIVWMRKRGMVDAPLRLAIFAAVAFAVLMVPGLLVADGTTSLVLFSLGSFWGYVPAVAAFSALGEALPYETRARFAGVHTFSVGLITNSLGPFLVGFLSDTFFPQDTGLRYALAVMIMGSATLGILVILAGVKAYRGRMGVLTADHPAVAASMTA